MYLYQICNVSTEIILGSLHTFPPNVFRIRTVWCYFLAKLKIDRYFTFFIMSIRCLDEEIYSMCVTYPFILIWYYIVTVAGLPPLSVSDDSHGQNNIAIDVHFSAW